MTDTALVRLRDLVGADVEAAVDSGRIAVDDLTRVTLRNGQREGTLASGGRPENGDQDRIRHQTHNSRGFTIIANAFVLSSTRNHRMRRITYATNTAATMTRPIRCDRVTGSRPDRSSRRFVVEERDREERLLGRILRRQRLRGVRCREGAERCGVERVDWAWSGDREIRDRPILVHVER